MGNSNGKNPPAGGTINEKDSANSAQQSSSGEPTKEQSTVAAPDQTKEAQPKQDILPAVAETKDLSSDTPNVPALAETKDPSSDAPNVPALAETKDPSSDTPHVPALAETKDPPSDTPNALGELQQVIPEEPDNVTSIPSQEDISHVEHTSEHREGPIPDQHGANTEEPVAHSADPISAAQLQPGEALDKDVATDCAISRKEETDVAAADETMAEQKLLAHHEVTEPAPGISETSTEVLEVSPVDSQSCELTKPFTPIQEQVSHAGHFEPPNPDAHDDDKTPPPLVSDTHSLEFEPDSTPGYDDVHPRSVDEPVTGFVYEQETEKSTAFQASEHPEHESISTPKASSDIFGEVEPLEATSELIHDDQNVAPSEPLFDVESIEEETTVSKAEQTEMTHSIIGQLDTQDDSNEEPDVNQVQVSHSQCASEPHEESPLEVDGAFIEETRITSPSREESLDENLSSPPILVDVYPSSGDQQTTTFLPSPPTPEALGQSKPTEDVPVDVLNKPKSLEQPSNNQGVTSPTVVPTLSPNTQVDKVPGGYGGDTDDDFEDIEDEGDYNQEAADEDSSEDDFEEAE